MTQQTLIRGENRLITRAMLLDDGVTPLLRSSLAAAQVQVMQGGVVLHTFVYLTNNQLRAGDANNELLFELTSEVTAALELGDVVLRWKLQVTDADFEVEDPAVFIDFIDETPWRVAA